MTFLCRFFPGQGIRIYDPCLLDTSGSRPMCFLWPWNWLPSVGPKMLQKYKLIYSVKAHMPHLFYSEQKLWNVTPQQIRCLCSGFRSIGCLEWLNQGKNTPEEEMSFLSHAPWCHLPCFLASPLLPTKPSPVCASSHVPDRWQSEESQEAEHERLEYPFSYFWMFLMNKTS